MPKPSECRLLLDPPGPGAWNMAVDETLLEWSTEAEGCCGRLYGWEEPTLSLGYFQRYHDRDRHLSSRNCPAVRRLTGGGAILHDAELTYSIVVPGRHPLAARRDLLYETIHTALIEVLADMGIDATLCGVSSDRRQGEEPFLCFQRRSAGDVLVGQTKVAGSAQRRRRGAVLQHGSVLLGRCDAAPELSGLQELAGQTIEPGTLGDAWLATLSRRLALTWFDEPLSQQQRDRAATLVRSRYASSRWVETRR